MESPFITLILVVVLLHMCARPQSTPTPPFRLLTCLPAPNYSPSFTSLALPCQSPHDQLHDQYDLLGSLSHPRPSSLKSPHLQRRKRIQTLLFFRRSVSLETFFTEFSSKILTTIYFAPPLQPNAVLCTRSPRQLLRSLSLSSHSLLCS